MGHMNLYNKVSDSQKDETDKYGKIRSMKEQGLVNRKNPSYLQLYPQQDFRHHGKS